MDAISGSLLQAPSIRLTVPGCPIASLSPIQLLPTVGVQGHPEYGEDSPLVRAMGYVPFSARKSGLTLRSKAGSGDPAAKGETAV